MIRILVLCVTFLGLTAATPWFCHSTSCPPFRTLSNTSYEVRQYPALAWLQTTVEGVNMTAAVDSGLARLAAYLNGANSASKHLPKSVPALDMVYPGSGPFCKTDFTSAYYLGAAAASTFPAPTSSDVSVNANVPEFTVAVKSFFGSADLPSIAKQVGELAAALAADGHAIHTDNYTTASYPSSYNEVWLPFTP